jgi:hypothetical protein
VTGSLIAFKFLSPFWQGDGEMFNTGTDIVLYIH